VIIKKSFDAANISGVKPRLIFCTQDTHCNYETEFGITGAEIERQGRLLELLTAEVNSRISLFRVISDERFPDVSLKPVAQSLFDRLKNQRANNSGL
jgi:hypothetical protein